MDNQHNYVQQLFKDGSKLLQAGSAQAALSCFQSALAAEPQNAILYLHAGAALHDLERHDEALACYSQAMRISPHLGEAHNNRGNTLMALGYFAEAAESFATASDLLATSPIPLAARATALQALGKVTEAESECRKAVLLAPHFAAAHWNLSLNLLLQGRYAEGWQEYEWRWQKPDFTSTCRHTDIPLWDGSSLDGKIILLHAEQGFGDAIQFVRYAPIAAQYGGTVVIECHPQLTSLFRSVRGVHSVISFGGPLPPVSFQAPLLSLPRIFGTTLETIPAHCPYLAVLPEYQDKWKAIMPNKSTSLRVGLVWAGKSYPDPRRSCRLEDFAPLALMQRVEYYSLQVGIGADQAQTPPNGMALFDLTSQIDNFADSAALIEQLDLVITIDTAIAHLAGALGKPVFLLLPFAPDWRWMLERIDSPWYPTMHLHRQKSPGDWGSVIRKLTTELSASIYPE